MVGAGPQERTRHRYGYRKRSQDTRVCMVELGVPRVRDSS